MSFKATNVLNRSPQGLLRPKEKNVPQNQNTDEAVCEEQFEDHTEEIENQRMVQEIFCPDCKLIIDDSKTKSIWCIVCRK
jgi:hypothetical protein